MKRRLWLPYDLNINTVTVIFNLKCRVFSPKLGKYLNFLNKSWHIYEGWPKGYCYFIVTLKSKYE